MEKSKKDISHHLSKWYNTSVFLLLLCNKLLFHLLNLKNQQIIVILSIFNPAEWSTVFTIISFAQSSYIVCHQRGHQVMTLSPSHLTPLFSTIAHSLMFPNEPSKNYWVTQQYIISSFKNNYNIQLLKEEHIQMLLLRQQCVQDSQLQWGESQQDIYRS